VRQGCYPGNLTQYPLGTGKESSGLVH
jgi:hypothetical protein